MNLPPQAMHSRSTLSTPDARRAADLQLLEQNLDTLRSRVSYTAPHCSHALGSGFRSTHIARPCSECHSLPALLRCHSLAFSRAMSMNSLARARNSGSAMSSDVCIPECSRIGIVARFAGSLLSGSPSTWCTT